MEYEISIPQVTNILFLWDFPVSLGNSKKVEQQSTITVESTNKKYEIVHKKE